MSSTTNIFQRHANEQSWNDASQRDVLERYIDNQRDDDALVEYLTEAALNEGEEVDGADLEDIAEEMGWDDSSIVIHLLSYIESQDADDAFDDFLVEQVEMENSPAY